MPPRLRKTPVAGPIPETLASSSELRVAMFGDSVMWGQGLNRDERFSWLAASAIARAKGRDRVRVVRDFSRSGAKIAATLDERAAFIDTFPEVFRTKAARNRFLDGDEGAATQLHGEIPATFPTVEWQVLSMPDDEGAQVDVAFLTGGANDLGFEEIIDPREFPGKFVEMFEGTIPRVSLTAMVGLIASLRRKCPRAVIIVFGYHSALSADSSMGALRGFFKHELDDDFGWYLNKILGVVPVNQMVREARLRSMWGAAAANEHMRHAVAIANRLDQVRGPGVVFVSGNWGATHAAFTHDQFVHQDYTDPADDHAAAERRKHCPRLDRVQDLGTLLLRLVVPGSDVSVAKQVRDKLSGPDPLLRALDRYIDGKTEGSQARTEIGLEIRREMGRIQRALIASFFHPNHRGARRYADDAVERWTALEKFLSSRPSPVDGPVVVVPVPGGKEADDQLLRRFGLRGTGPLEADWNLLDVDSIGLTVVTERASSERMAADLRLAIVTGEGTRTHLLNFPYEIVVLPKIVGIRKYHHDLEPASTDDFRVAVERGLRLRDITKIQLRLADVETRFPGLGYTWRPRRVQLRINGIVVQDLTFSQKKLEPGDTLDLGYPPPRVEDGQVKPT